MLADGPAVSAALGMNELAPTRHNPTAPHTSFLYVMAAPYLSTTATHLSLFHRNGDYHSAHHIIDLEVVLRTVGMSVMASYARLRDGSVRVDRLKVQLPFLFNDFREGTIRVHEDGFEARSLEPF